MILEHNLAALQLLTEGRVGAGASAMPIKGLTAGVRRCAREGKPLVVPAFFTEHEVSGGGGLGCGLGSGIGGGNGSGVDVPVNPSPCELLFMPMRLHGKVALVLMVAVMPPGMGGGNEHSLHRTYLNFLARMVGSVEQTLTDRHLNLMEKDRGTSSKLVRFAEQVHKHLFLGQVAADIANLARDILSADRVTAELYPTGRMKKKVIAVSNVDEPNKRATTMQVQRLLFDYVRDRQVPVAMDREGAKQLASDPALQDAATAYFGACALDAFLLAPIKADDPTSPVVGVLLVEYGNGGGHGEADGTPAVQRAQANVGLLAEIARLSTGSVANAMDMESLPLIKSFYALRKIWRAPTASGRAMVLTMTGLVMAAVVVLGFVPFDFAIKADCQIRPSAQLSIVSPLEERIVDIPVRAGEHVYPKGGHGPDGEEAKPLAVLDATELIAQRAEAVGKLESQRLEMKDFERRGDQAKVAGAQVEIKQLQTQIDLLQQQIEQCTVWSPIEGTVLTENVEQKRWSTPKKSEPLMEVASFTDWQLVVDVPESEVAGVRTALEAATKKSLIDGRADQGIDVEYILTSFPEKRYAIRARGVATVLPASQQSKNANVFRLQVKLDAASLPPGVAMSGLTGRAKVHVGRMPLGAQWLRGAVRLVRMTMMF